MIALHFVRLMCKCWPLFTMVQFSLYSASLIWLCVTCGDYPLHDTHKNIVVRSCILILCICTCVCARRGRACVCVRVCVPLKLNSVNINAIVFDSLNVCIFLNFRNYEWLFLFTFLQIQNIEMLIWPKNANLSQHYDFPKCIRFNNFLK